MNCVDPYTIGFCRALHRDRLGEQAYASPCGAIPGYSADPLRPATKFGDIFYPLARHVEDHMITGLHHNAYRCRDSEETRAFYEDFLGLPLSGALAINETKSGRQTKVLHTFFRMDDGSFLAFFEAPDMPFEFKPQHDFDLHIALEVTPEVLQTMLAKGKAAGIETRGPSDHRFIDSI